MVHETGHQLSDLDHWPADLKVTSQVTSAAGNQYTTFQCSTAFYASVTKLDRIDRRIDELNWNAQCGLLWGGGLRNNVILRNGIITVVTLYAVSVSNVSRLRRWLEMRCGCCDCAIHGAKASASGAARGRTTRPSGRLWTPLIGDSLMCSLVLTASSGCDWTTTSRDTFGESCQAGRLHQILSHDECLLAGARLRQRWSRRRTQWV